MLDGRLQSVVRYLQRTLGARAAGGLTDDQLLERFIHAHDAAALEVLVWRHGTLVWNVCRRVLPREQDAEDAFQATFLTFTRKARSIGRGAAVASWLYKVAYRIALDARGRLARQARREGGAWNEPTADATDDLAWRDLRPMLDAEVSALPEKYRRAFVLCYLEGKTNAEAAAELGCSPGTIFSRLAWARERLRSRLTRRGVTLAAGALALTLADHAARAEVPAGLVTSTAQGAAAWLAGHSTAGLVSAQALVWMERATRSLLLVRLKVAGLVLTTVAAAGVPWLGRGGHRPAAEAPPAEVAREPQVPAWEPLTARSEVNGQLYFSARSLRRPGSQPGETIIADTVVSHANAASQTFNWTGERKGFEAELTAAGAPAARTQLWNTFGAVREGAASLAVFATPAEEGKANAVTLATLWGLVLSSGRQDLLAAYSLLEQKPQTVLPCARWLSDGSAAPAPPGTTLFGKLTEGGETSPAVVTFSSSVIEASPGRLTYRYRVENTGPTALTFRWAGFAATVGPGQAFERLVSSSRLTEEVPARATFTWAGGKRHAIAAHYWKPPS